VITGYKEGVDEINRLFEQLSINTKIYKIIGKNLKINQEEFGYQSKPTRYRFITPWLALNKDNYKRFKNSNQAQKKELLERILTGNILSASKSLGYEVPNRLNTRIIWAKQINCTLKGTKVMGFKGLFETNFLLPHLFGLGKSVSRGFGATTRLPGG